MIEPNRLRDIRLEERHRDGLRGRVVRMREAHRADDSHDEDEGRGGGERAAALEQRGGRDERGRRNDEKPDAVRAEPRGGREPHRMSVEGLRGEVPGESPVDVRASVLDGEPEDREDGQPEARARRSDGDGGPPHDRWPLSEDRGEDPERENAHRFRLPSESRHHEDDPGNRNAPVRVGEQDPRDEPAPALVLRRESRDPGNEGERREERELVRREREREEDAGDDARERRPPAREATRHLVQPVILSAAKDPPKRRRFLVASLLGMTGFFLSGQASFSPRNDRLLSVMTGSFLSSRAKRGICVSLEREPDSSSLRSSE